MNSFPVQFRDTVQTSKTVRSAAPLLVSELFVYTTRHGVTARTAWGLDGGSGGPVPGKGGVKVDDLKRFQIHCPRCRHEFVWNMDDLDQEREKLKKRHGLISQMISDMRANNSPDALGYSREFKRLRAESTQIIERLTALKAIKKNNQAITDEIYNREFKDLVRERYGEEEYFRLIEIVKERLKPISTERIMMDQK